MTLNLPRFPDLDDAIVGITDHRELLITSPAFRPGIPSARRPNPTARKPTSISVRRCGHCARRPS